jgi:chromosome segregation ATPase
MSMKLLNVLVIMMIALVISFLWAGSKHQQQIDNIEKKQKSFQLEDDRISGEVNRIDEEVIIIKTDLAGVRTGVDKLDERITSTTSEWTGKLDAHSIRFDALQLKLEELGSAFSGFDEIASAELEQIKSTLSAELEQIKSTLSAELQKSQQALDSAHQNQLELVRRQQETEQRLQDVTTQMQEILLRLIEQDGTPPDPR